MRRVVETITHSLVKSLVIFSAGFSRVDRGGFNLASSCRVCPGDRAGSLLSSTIEMSLPPSSPRLPSPPPPTEIQIGPKSPALGSFSSLEPTIEQSVLDANASRRIHPGTRAADMAAGPPLIPLNEVNMPYLRAILCIADPHDSLILPSSFRNT